MKKNLLITSIFCLCILSLVALAQQSHASTVQKEYKAEQDVSLIKPSAGKGVTINAKAGDRYVFEFESSLATLERKGKSFLLSFADGGSIEIVDFYNVFKNPYLPDFVVNGDMVVSGADFFSYLSEALMP